LTFIAAGLHLESVQYVCRRRSRIEDRLRRFQQEGVIPWDVEVVQLARRFATAVQGGYRLAQTSRDVKPMASAIDMAKVHLQLLARDQGEAP
jgi:hypothetical protein